MQKCKYVQEKIKIENLTDGDLEKSESDSDSNDEIQNLILIMMNKFKKAF